jgi:hypothetical protein
MGRLLLFCSTTMGTLLLFCPTTMGTLLLFYHTTLGSSNMLFCASRGSTGVAVVFAYTTASELARLSITESRIQENMFVYKLETLTTLGKVTYRCLPNFSEYFRFLASVYNKA